MRRQKGANRSTVIRKVEAVFLQGSQLTDLALWRIQVTEQDIQKLKPKELCDD